MLARLASPAFAVVFMGALIATGCASGTEVPRTSPTTADVPESESTPVSTVDAIQAGESGEGAAFGARYGGSLPVMLLLYPEVFVGEVTGILVPFDPRRGYLGVETPDAPGDESGLPDSAKPSPPTPSAEELARPPGTNFTIYEVKVISILAGGSGVKEGDVVGVLQTGGTFGGERHETVGDPLISQNSAYLFFAKQMIGLEESTYVKETWGRTYNSAPEGRFVLDADGRLSLAEAASIESVCPECEGPKFFPGKTVDEARALVAKASTDLAEILATQ